MPARQFTITELRRAGDGGYVETPVQFVWTAEGHSAPANSWRFGIQMRSVRTDYPGSDEPSEQILGSNQTEFSINGVWDDRYNYPGFALEMMRSMETVVQRAALMRFAFETVSVNGLIKSAEFDYKLASKISYMLTVSPHNRVDGSPTRPGPARARTPDGLQPIEAFKNTASATMASIALNELEVPKNQMVGDTAATTGASVASLQERVADLVTAIDQRLDPRVEEFESLKRVAASLQVIKGDAAQLAFELHAARSDTELAWQSAKGVLDFEVWMRGLRAKARLLALTSYTGAEEVSRRVEPKAIALYRPSRGESLYAISQRFYGTPHQWRGIAEANGLTTLTLQGTETLLIPERR